jgi:hypothetical protein
VPTGGSEQHHEQQQQQQQQPHDEENPFVSDGELSHKADYIIHHSTITRNELHIVDPDVNPDDDVTANGETVIKSQNAHGSHAAPTNGNARRDGTGGSGRCKCCTVL